MLAQVLAAALAASPKLAVLPVLAGEGIPPSTASAITEALTGEVRRRAGGEVISQREISAILSLERQREMLGCATDACMAELGGALGCDRLVTGDLARLGESLLVHLRLVEARRVRVVVQADRRLRGGTIDDVLDALPAMVQELFPGGPAPVGAAAAPERPPGGEVSAPARPAPRPWVEEPVALGAGERQRLSAWADADGRLVVADPHGNLDDLVFAGDDRKLFRLRLHGSASNGPTSSSVFWEPRVRRGAESELEWRGGQATLTCGERRVELRPLSPEETTRLLAGVTFHAPRWRRIPRALARDDDGTFYYVDAARRADGREDLDRPDLRLWIGRKGKLVHRELQDTLPSAGGYLLVSVAGRLDVRRERGEMGATWIDGTGRRPLTWLEPAASAQLIYGELGVYAGERLGTPCDGSL
jgi:TolB-like protein